MKKEVSEKHWQKIEDGVGGRFRVGWPAAPKN
jgi:hypothetical protein